MEVEETLPEETPADGVGVQPGPVTDGLAAEVAAEEVEQPETPGGGPATPSGKRVGRPPIHGLYSKAAGSDGKNPALAARPPEIPAGEVALGATRRVSLPPDLLSRVVEQTLELGEFGFQTAIAGKARLAGLSNEEIAPQLLRAQLGEKSKALVADITPLALEEWGLDAQVSPTTAIGVILLPWLSGSAMAYLTLASLAKERAQRFGPSQEAAPAAARADHTDEEKEES